MLRACYVETNVDQGGVWLCFFVGEMPPTPHPVFILLLQDQTVCFHKPANLHHHTDTSLFQLIPDLITPTGHITLPHWILEICNINGAEEMHPACNAEKHRLLGNIHIWLVGRLLQMDTSKLFPCF